MCLINNFKFYELIFYELLFYEFISYELIFYKFSFIFLSFVFSFLLSIKIIKLFKNAWRSNDAYFKFDWECILFCI